jgi:hypothetical protein
MISEWRLLNAVQASPPLGRWDDLHDDCFARDNSYRAVRQNVYGVWSPTGSQLCGDACCAFQLRKGCAGGSFGQVSALNFQGPEAFVGR